MLFLCPVCYFNQMPDPPEDYNICPCCGTEFGLDDEFKHHMQLRQEWIEGGMKWFFREPPPFWNPASQLTNIHVCIEPVSYWPVGTNVSSVLAIHDVYSSVVSAEGYHTVHTGALYGSTYPSMNVFPCFDMAAAAIVEAGDDDIQQYELAGRQDKYELAEAS